MGRGKAPGKKSSENRMSYLYYYYLIIPLLVGVGWFQLIIVKILLLFWL
jgi:hypothetical protein